MALTPGTTIGRAGLIDLGWFLISADGRSYVYSYRRNISTLYVGIGLR
jgi:hypothetical protein